jgi:hypothetical protein
MGDQGPLQGDRWGIPGEAGRFSARPAERPDGCQRTSLVNGGNQRRGTCGELLFSSEQKIGNLDDAV